MHELLQHGNYLFKNKWDKTRNGFSHTSILIDIRDSSVIRTKKINYINRTWEPYEYYTSMSYCVQNEIDKISTEIKNNYKKINNIKRVNTTDKINIVNKINHNKTIQELNELKDFLKLL